MSCELCVVLAKRIFKSSFQGLFFREGTFGITQLSKSFMYTTFTRAMRNALAAAAMFSIVGCSETVSPTEGDADNDVLEVNANTGETSIDTIDLGNNWPRIQSRSDEYITFARHLEVEEFGDEAVTYIKNNWNFDLAEITAMQDDEKSHHDALHFVLKKLEIVNLADSLDPKGCSGLGDFSDDSTQAQWEYLELCRPKDANEAYLAFAFVCEYQLKRSLDGLNGSQTPEERELWTIIVNMNKNHFVAMLRKLSALGVEFKPWFLTQEQVADYRDDTFVVQ